MSDANSLQDAIRSVADGVVLRIVVQPKARREQWVGMHGGRLKLAVTEPPDKGKANAAVLRFVAASLRLPASGLSLLRGETSRQKDLQVRGLSAETVIARLVESGVSEPEGT